MNMFINQIAILKKMIVEMLKTIVRNKYTTDFDVLVFKMDGMPHMVLTTISNQKTKYERNAHP